VSWRGSLHHSRTLRLARSDAPRWPGRAKGGGSYQRRDPLLRCDSVRAQWPTLNLLPTKPVVTLVAADVAVIRISEARGTMQRGKGTQRKAVPLRWAGVARRRKRVAQINTSIVPQKETAAQRAAARAINVMRGSASADNTRVAPPDTPQRPGRMT